ETSSPVRRLEQHPIARGIRRAVRHAMLNHVDVHASAHRARHFFTIDSVHDLAHGEVCALWMVSMEKRRRNPNLVGHLQGLSMLAHCGWTLGLRTRRAHFAKGIRC